MVWTELNINDTDEKKTSLSDFVVDKLKRKEKKEITSVVEFMSNSHPTLRWSQKYIQLSSKRIILCQGKIFHI